MTARRDLDDAWRRLIRSSRTESDAPPNPLAPPLSDRVVEAWRSRRATPLPLVRSAAVERFDDRLLGAAAVVALAASLVLVVADWDLLRAAFAPHPVLLEACISVEPLP